MKKNAWDVRQYNLLHNDFMAQSQRIKETGTKNNGIIMLLIINYLKASNKLVRILVPGFAFR